MRKLIAISVVLISATGIAVAQPAKSINCFRTPARCEIVVAGKKLSLGMPQARVLELFGSDIAEDRKWSDEKKPDTQWLIGGRRGSIEHALVGAVRFRGGKLDGALAYWAPLGEASDFAASLIGLLEKLYKEGSRECILTTDTLTTPTQETRSAYFRCGVRSVVVEHNRFQLAVGDQKVQEEAEIYETLGNW